MPSSIEHFFGEPLSADLAARIDAMPDDQFDVLFDQIVWCQQKWFSRRYRADGPHPSDLVFHGLGVVRGLPETVSWLRSALLYFPGRVVVEDTFANAYSRCGARDDGFLRYRRGVVVESAAAFVPLRALLADGTLRLMPDQAVSEAFTDLIPVDRGDAEYHDTPSFGDIAPTTELLAALAAWAEHEHLTEFGDEFDGDTFDAFAYEASHQIRVGDLLGYTPVATDPHSVTAMRVALRNLPAVDSAVTELLRTFRLPAFERVPLDTIVAVRRDEEAFAAVRVAVEDILRRVAAADPRDQPGVTANVRREAESVVADRLRDLRRAMAGSPALDHAVSSVVAFGATAATYAVTREVTAGAVAGLAADQAAWVLSRAARARTRAARGAGAAVDLFCSLTSAT